MVDSGDLGRAAVEGGGEPIESIVAALVGEVGALFILIAQGEHPKVIQERLGHASTKTTLDIYGHLFDGLDEAAADRLDKVWHGADVYAMWTRRGRSVIELPTK
jgi:hypothetical protein